MRFGSLFSGIEAASAAWLPLGWSCAWVAEIDPFACAVLRHHYPNVPNLGDITKVRWNAVEPVDLVVGGPPCQDFSVAGQRAGLEGERGNLSLEYVRALDAIDPAWSLTENVPGWLSMADNAFGHFLGRLVGHHAPLVPGRGQCWTDAGVVAGPRRTAAWRICDAQYFGVPQRRRRVFVLASRGAGNWACAEALFPQRQSVQRDFAPRREAGQDTAAGAGDGSAYSCRPNAHDAAWRGDGADNFVGIPDPAYALAAGRQGSGSVFGSGRDAQDTFVCSTVVPPLMSRGHSNGRSQTLSMGFTTDEHIVCFSAKDHGADAGDTAPTLRAGGHSASHANAGVMPAIAQVVGPLTANGGSAYGEKLDSQHYIAFQANAGRDFTADEDRSPPLRSGGTGGTGGVAIAHSLRADGFDASDPTARQPEWSLDRAMKTDGPPAVAFTASEQANGFAWERDVYPTLHSQVPNDTSNIQQGIRTGMSVRRLLPVECEKLQGLPPGYTDVPYRGKPAADGPRYRAIGNSMAVPVIAWLGRRIQRVTDTMELSDAAE